MIRQPATLKEAVDPSQNILQIFSTYSTEHRDLAYVMSGLRIFNSTASLFWLLSIIMEALHRLTMEAETLELQICKRQALHKQQ